MPRHNRKSMPGYFATGAGIYPIIPYRVLNRIDTFAAASNEREIMDFDLEFENNEVMDIVMIHILFEWDLAASMAVDTDLTVLLGVFEDPDKATVTDIDTEALFEDDASLLFMEQSGRHYDFVAAGVSTTSPPIVESRQFLFPQPYTVARNLAIILQGNGSEGDATAVDVRTTIWGRRRRASDSEFKNIIYRQRF